MEDLIEDGVADAIRASVLDEREGESLAHDWQMSRAEEAKRGFRHRRHALSDACGIIACT